MKKLFAIASLVALGVLAAPRSAAADETAELAEAFRDYSGAELVFRARDLPRGRYHDIMRELPVKRREAAARIALREVEKYPRGYLGRIGMKAIGVFDGLASKRGDGFRPYDKDLGGYRYFGLWNGTSALVAAYYTDGQLPLTLHHEIFHHVDATRAGKTSYGKRFYADDGRFEDAVKGRRRYRALRLSAADAKALAKRARGTVLRDAVSGYAAKSKGEDQAETARHLMTNLPDALLQMARRPELPGSQRMLHVLAQYRIAVPNGPAADWFVDVALGRTGARERQRLARAARSAMETMRSRIRPRDGDRVFTVWGGEDGSGANWTLRSDLWSFGRRIEAIDRMADGVAGGEVIASRTGKRSLRLLARYRSYIDSRWSITRGTDRYFDWARRRMIAAVADARDRRRLARASWAELAGVEARPAPKPKRNRYSDEVDDAIDDAEVRRAIHRVQPAAVRLDNGSGVNLTADGLVLTAGHVAPRVGMKKTVLFPDGRRFSARAIAVSGTLDIAVLRIDGDVDRLPVAPLASSAPEVGTMAICIGQPGRSTPGGEPTGYQPFHVSVGQIRGFLPDRLGNQSLGRTKHDAWTYWGHSGSPIFDEGGRIIAMHNSWDSKTAMRHAVTWEALVAFLRKHRVGFAVR